MEKLSKVTFAKIEGYMENLDALKNEIKLLKELALSEDPAPTEIGYLVSTGTIKPVKEKSVDDIKLLESILRKGNYDDLSGYEYRVPCKNHIANSSICAVYGFHMSKCPMTQRESYGCEVYEGGYPGESIFEERVSQHLHYHYPEILAELSIYLETGERPPASLMLVLMNLKRNFERDGAKDYMNVLLGRNVSKKKAESARKPFSTRERFEVLKKHNFSCFYCGRTSADNIKLHVDHVIPVAKGGTNDFNNLVAACEDCNLGKSDINL